MTREPVNGGRGEHVCVRRRGSAVKKVSGGETTVYIYDALGQMAGETTSGTNGSPCSVCYLSVDHLGSTKMVTDGGGAVVSLHDYLPFGQEIAGGTYGRSSLFGSGTDGVTRKFTGKERDAESGLDYFGARYYGSALGRWTSPDWSAVPQAVPYADLSDPQTLNQYAYVQNNPSARGDQDGHCPLCITVEELAATPEGREIGELLSRNFDKLMGATVLLGSSLANSGSSCGGGPGCMAEQLGKLRERQEKENALARNAHGARGAPDHQQTVQEEADKLKGGKTEQRIPTPGGNKDVRVADATGIDPTTGKPKIVQVYRPRGKKGVIPRREVDAANDIGRATGIQPTMVPVRPRACIGCDGPPKTPALQ